MQDPEQTRAWALDKSPDTGDSVKGRAGPQRPRKMKRVRPQAQGECAVSTPLCSPGKPAVAKRKKTTPASAKKPVTSAAGNAPPTVVAVPVKIKKTKKDIKNHSDYASAVRSEVHPRAAFVDADATEPSVAQKKRVKKARAAARAAAAAEAAAAEAVQAADEVKKAEKKAMKQKTRIARERDA